MARYVPIRVAIPQDDLDPFNVLDAFSYGLAQYGGDTMGLYPGFDADDDAEFDRFRFYDEEDALEAVGDVIYAAQALPDPLPVWRALEIDDPDLITQPYGKHWSWSPEGAEEYAKYQYGCKKPIWLLRGTVPHEAVDWDEVFAHWIVHSLAEDAPREDEIYVEDQDALRNVEVVGQIC